MAHIIALRVRAGGGREGVDFTVQTVRGDFFVSRETLQDLARVGEEKVDLVRVFDDYAQAICQAAADLVEAGASGHRIVVPLADARRALSKVGRGRVG